MSRTVHTWRRRLALGHYEFENGNDENRVTEPKFFKKYCSFILTFLWIFGVIFFVVFTIDHYQLESEVKNLHHEMKEVKKNETKMVNEMKNLTMEKVEAAEEKILGEIRNTTAAEMKELETRIIDDIRNLTNEGDPYYDFSDEEEDEEDDYGGDGEYLDYDPEKSQIVVDNEYESASNLTKDGRDGNGKQIVKRSIVATTKDGLLVNSESYSNSKAKNSTHRRRPLHKHHHEGKSVTEMPGKLSAFGYPWSYRQTVYQNTNSKLSAERIAANLPQNGGTNSPVNVPKKPSISVRRSRVMRGEDPPKSPRKIVKKPFLKAGDLEYDSYYHSGEISTTAESTMVPEAAIGRHRKLGRSRPLISIHFSGDTSKYVLGKHDNFNGNGHLRHLQRNFIDWTPSDWVKKTGMESHFVMNEGIVTIKESGLYFVYAQIYYLDEHDTTGYRVYKNHDMFLQCTITQHSSIGLVKGNTCYTAGVEFLTTGDTVYLADITQGKYSLFEPGKSFFGLIKLGDFKNK